jgi:hypothetical protein
MTTNIQALIATLDLIVALLERHGEELWSWWLRYDTELLRRGDLAGLDHFLASFGGMGSFNDLFLCPENCAKIAAHEVSPVNGELQRLQTLAYEQGRACRAT